MRYYLSSYELGSAARELQALAPNGAIAYVPNARDFSNSNIANYRARTKSDMSALEALPLQVSLLDLRDYFGDRSGLAERVARIGAIFVSGGNTFILRQAMKISGLDEVLQGFREDDGFLYSGYSAAGCVLAPKLDGYEFVDPVEAPYPEHPDVIWEGLGHVDFRIVPHWRSDHPEAADVEKVIEHFRRNDIPCRPIRDGEALITDRLRRFAVVGSASGRN